MSMESNLFAVSFSQSGTFVEGSLGPGGMYRLPVDATLVGVSFFAGGAGNVALQLDVDEGDSRILDKVIPAGGYSATMFGRRDFGYATGQPPLFAPNQYPHITKDHTVRMLTNVESGTVYHITVVFYFLAG